MAATAQISSMVSEPKREIMSSLCLQMALHFHVYLLPFVLVCQIACFVLKYNYIHETYRVILIAVHVISIVVECVRPVLGFYGNLGEKIPALSGFWISSVILQTPIYLFLAINLEILPLPLERFVYIVHFVFLQVEIISVTRLIRRLANYQMEKFRSTIFRNETALTSKSSLSTDSIKSEGLPKKLQ